MSHHFEPNSGTERRYTGLLAIFVAFGALGVFSEVMFTATALAVRGFRTTGLVDWRLAGTSYIWMFPIYGLAGPLLVFGFPRIAKFRVLVRVGLYVFLIYVVEFTAGYALKKAVGVIPWRYDAGVTIEGFVRLDYAGYWALLGLAFERAYLFLAPRLVCPVATQSVRPAHVTVSAVTPE